MNLAARLESHTKLAGQPSLLDGVIEQGLHHRCGVDSLGPVLVKGKAAPVEVFSVQPGQTFSF